MIKKTIDLKKYAYDEIKKRIVNCIYEPGILLNEQVLAGELNISRTPLREALNRLHQEGLIQIISKKGILVNGITITDMIQLYQVRIELEPFVVRLSGPHLDQEKLLYFRELFSKESDEDDNLQHLETDMEFHRYLADHCNNKYTQKLMNEVLDDNKRVMISTKNKNRIDHSNNEHLKIIALLLPGDYEGAAQVMAQHIMNCRDSAFNYFLNRGN